LITGYSGLDPEINTNKERNGVPSRGIDYTAYPSARTFTLGLNASFKKNISMKKITSIAVICGLILLTAASCAKLNEKTSTGLNRR
jgi:hypothetical protein